MFIIRSLYIEYLLKAIGSICVNCNLFEFEFFFVEYANNFDQPVAFQCPNGGVMDGVSSYHDNGAEDRRFRFYCCEKPGFNQKQ